MKRFSGFDGAMVTIMEWFFVLALLSMMGLLLWACFGCDGHKPLGLWRADYGKGRTATVERRPEIASKPKCVKQRCPRDLPCDPVRYQVDACWDRWPDCMGGPRYGASPICTCLFDLDEDGDVDLANAADVQRRIQP